MVCDSYYDAIKTESQVKIVVIDMGLWGLHMDAAELLIPARWRSSWRFLADCSR